MEDLATVKPEATTTSCRKTQDNQQQAEKPGIKTERTNNDKYTIYSPEGGQIEAADVASGETLNKTSQQIATGVKSGDFFLFGVPAAPKMALKPPLRADKETADSLNNHVTETQPDETSVIYSEARRLRQRWLPCPHQGLWGFGFHQDSTVGTPKTPRDAAERRIIPDVLTVPTQITDKVTAL